MVHDIEVPHGSPTKFKTATKEEAIYFLEHFRQTHLATYNLEAAVKTVSSAKVLKGHSERICAGYFLGFPAERKQIPLSRADKKFLWRVTSSILGINGSYVMWTLPLPTPNINNYAAESFEP